MEPLLNYFEKNWLSNIDIWNVYAAESRTNNICEGNIEKDFAPINIFFFKPITAELTAAFFVIIQIFGSL
jgi:hypothetical protein